MAKTSAIADMLVEEFTGTFVQEWALALGVSLLTAKGHARRLRTILAKAGNPVRVVMPEVPRKPKATVWGRDSDEFVKWASELPENRRRAVLAVYLTGLSRYELLGLKHEDREGDFVFLRRGVTETKDAVYVSPELKTARRADWVYLPPELDFIGQGSGWVFPGKNPADPMKPHSFTVLVSRTVAKTKWKNISPQALRRGFGQAVWEKTGDVKATAGVMRHSIKMTDEQYVQMDQQLKKRLHQQAFGKIGAKTSRKKRAN